MTECAASVLTPLIIVLGVPTLFLLWGPLHNLMAQLPRKVTKVAGPRLVLALTMMAVGFGVVRMNQNAVPCHKASATTVIPAMAAICSAR